MIQAMHHHVTFNDDFGLTFSPQKRDRRILIVISRSGMHHRGTGYYSTMHAVVKPGSLILTYAGKFSNESAPVRHMLMGGKASQFY